MPQDHRPRTEAGAETEQAAERRAEVELSEAPEQIPPERRRFFGWLAAGLAGAASLAMAVPWLVFLVSPAVRREPNVWRVVGRVADFEIGSTVHVTYFDATPLPWAGFAARSAAWLRREAEHEFVAFTVYCTHVGCPVRWEEGAQLFMCPCHGGVFYRDGRVASGPPIRPLDRYPVRVRNGNVEIQAVGVPVPRRVI